MAQTNRIPDSPLERLLSAMLPSSRAGKAAAPPLAAYCWSPLATGEGEDERIHEPYRNALS